MEYEYVFFMEWWLVAGFMAVCHSFFQFLGGFFAVSSFSFAALAPAPAPARARGDDDTFISFSPLTLIHRHESWVHVVRCKSCHASHHIVTTFGSVAAPANEPGTQERKGRLCQTSS